MDQFDIYVNVERPSGNPGKRKSLVKCSESIYENEDKIHTLEPNRTGPALSGAGDSKRVKKSSCRGAAVFLGLLCLLLLAGLITLVFLYTKGNSEWEMEMVLLHNSYSNNLTKERDQLQTSYNILSEERDQWQKRFEAMTKDRNDLQKKLLDCSHSAVYEQNGGKSIYEMKSKKSCYDDWVKFGTSCYYVSTEQKTWRESRNECQKKGADLVVINREEEQKFVIKFNKRVWIGLTDQHEEGVWKWVDGTTLTTKYWYPPQPDNNRGQGNKEDCAEIYVNNHDPLLKWNDVYCLHRNYWVCEII